MIDSLVPILRRLDIDPSEFTGDEVRRWPAGVHEALSSAGLVRRAEDAGSVECDACGEGHLEEIRQITVPPGTESRAYIACPEAGRILVEEYRIVRWRLDLQRVAAALASALSMKHAPAVVVPSRLWSLGPNQIGGRRREVFLARGLWWPDGAEVIGNAAGLQVARAPLILVAGVAGPLTGVMDVLPYLSWRQERLQLDQEGLASNPELDRPLTPWSDTASSLDNEGWYSVARLASAFRVDQERLRKRLERYRGLNFVGWHQVTDTAVRQSQFLYQLKLIQHIIDDLKSSGDRPEKSKSRRQSGRRQA